MSRRRINLLEYEQAVLLALYNAALEHSDAYLDRDDLASYIPTCGGQVVTICLQGLVAKDLVYTFSENGRDNVYITRKGFEAVDLWDDAQFWRIEAVLHPSEIKGDNASVIPASDRTVTLNHNQPDYEETVAALDTVIEEFRNDHRLDNELGHEKGALLKALEGGRELLNDTAVNVRVGLALIVEPLKRLVLKYDQALVGVLATAALEAVMKLFG